MVGSARAGEVGHSRPGASCNVRGGRRKLLSWSKNAAERCWLVSYRTLAPARGELAQTSAGPKDIAAYAYRGLINSTRPAAAAASAAETHKAGVQQSAAPSPGRSDRIDRVVECLLVDVVAIRVPTPPACHARLCELVALLSPSVLLGKMYDNRICVKLRVCGQRTQSKFAVS